MLSDRSWRNARSVPSHLKERHAPVLLEPPHAGCGNTKQSRRLGDRQQLKRTRWLLFKVLVGTGRHINTAVIAPGKLLVVVVGDGKLRAYVVETVADAYEFVRANIYDIVDIYEMRRECFGDKGDKHLLAQLAEFVGVHMVPVCAPEARQDMPRNIAG
jgi:hypothetical protein